MSLHNEVMTSAACDTQSSDSCFPYQQKKALAGASALEVGRNERCRFAEACGPTIYSVPVVSKRRTMIVLAALWSLPGSKPTGMERSTT